MRGFKYNILFLILFLFLVLHFLFNPLQIIKDSALNGYFEKPIETEFSLKNYFSRTYQDSTEKYLKYNFGLFPGLTRIHNQIEYSLFDKIHVHDVHKGKNGYLHRYVKGYFSNKDFDSYTLNHYFDLLKRFSDSLKASGKIVVWVISPDKSIVYKETLPEEIGSINHPINLLYESFKKELMNGNYNYIDFNELSIKEKNKYLFPVCNKGGIHWTQAYAARCFDSVCSYLNLVQKFNIQNKITYYKTGTVWGPDYDIEYAANLLVPLEKNDSSYLANVKTIISSKDKKLLLIGDSFCHAWMWNKFFAPVFNSESEFWYYNRDATTMTNDKLIRNADKKTIKKYIEKFDVFIINYSAANINMLDYGFLEDVFNNSVE